MTQETDTLVHDDEWIDDEALSEDDAFTDDQPDDEPPARSRRRRIPPVAIGLSAVVIAGLGFIGGVQVQKRSGGDATGGMPAGLAAMMQAGGPGTGAGAGDARGSGGGAGSGGSSSSSTTGEVANVKGSKLYVTAADGSTVEVVVGKNATVQRLAAADVDQVRPGDTVVVTGTTAGDGSVKATAVQATASGVSLLGGFGGRGGGPSGSGAPAGTDAAGSGASGSGPASGSNTDSDAPSGDDAVDQLFESGD